MSFLDFNFVTTFYIRKIENKHRIMSPATNKVIFFYLSNISNYFDT